MTATGKHAWKFVRIGGVDQIVFRNGADIAHIDELDQKLWMALAIPTRGIEFDTKSADLLDTDKDGRIRPPEIIAAVKWAATAFNDLSDLMKGGDAVALSAIKDPHLLAGAKRVLANLKKPDATVITLADVSDTVKILADTTFNGDGVIIAASAGEPVLQKAIEEIIAIVGPDVDRSGKPGLGQVKLDLFFAEAKKLADWAAKGEADTLVTPLGLEGTTAAVAALKAVRTKVDDFFVRCRLAAFDSRAIVALNREEKEYLAVAAKDFSLSAAELAGFPLAMVGANATLPLTGGLNPAWAAAMATFASATVTPLLGPSRVSLSEADWSALQAKVAAHEAWAASKPVTIVEKVGLPRLRELLANGTQAKIAALIAQDKALEGEFSQMAAVEKLVRFQKDLYELLTNSVNFADFYGKTGAVFQTGTLYLDNRSCNLCIDVTDAGKHAALAHLSGAYLAYCDLSRVGVPKRQVVALFTDGSSDNLIVGRNGVFYDRKGLDWDATITRIVANPISVREAFWTPYKKVLRMVEDQIAKRAAAAEAASSTKLSEVAQTVAEADKLKAAAPATPPPAGAAPPKKIDLGSIALIGAALGGISALLGGMLTAFFGLGVWMPLGVVAVLLLISGPSMMIAWMKLRKRNLGPVLDANGWAINNVAKMNIPFGASLTDMPELPAGSTRSLQDPFAEKSNPWPVVAVILIVVGIAYFILNNMGFIFEWSDGRLGTERPKPPKPPAVAPAVPGTAVAAPAAAAPAAVPAVPAK